MDSNKSISSAVSSLASSATGSMSLCAHCKAQTNERKIPIQLACNHTVCIACASTILLTNLTPQDQNSLSNISCPACDSTTTLSMLHLFAIDQYELLQEIAPVFKCSVHPSKQIEFLCSHDQHLICIDCFEDHKGHADMLLRMNQDMIVRRAERMMYEIERQERRLRVCKENLARIMCRESMPAHLVIQFLEQSVACLTREISEKDK